MEELLEKVKQFADKAHGSQMRKYTDERYIVHPVRVMELLKQYTQDVALLAAALLHDVLEDTPVKEQELNAFLLKIMPQEAAIKTMRLVIDLTDVYVKEAYPQWNRKKRKAMELQRLQMISRDSQTVKYADIIDNSIDIVKHDKGFAVKYLYEVGHLLKAIRNGDKRLYQRAVEIVNACRKELL